jgi:light-regulated signal transduction histidine kinase (bacteriophytochrome)
MIAKFNRLDDDHDVRWWEGVAMKLAGGRLTTRVPVEHDNEIGRLSRAFNIMAARLEDSQSRLMGAAESQTQHAMEAHEQQLLLTDSNRNLSEFAHGVSHDLKAPLRQITTFARMELERSSELELEARTTLEQVITLSSQMKELVDGVMSFADTDPSMRIPAEPAELSQVVDDVQNALRIRIEEAGASFEVGALQTVMAHTALMRQLFQNLIDNALK